MSETKHTEEGWKYDEIGAAHGCPRVVDKDGFPIADLRGWGHLTGSGALNLPPEEAARIQDARGRRIAAVNELLAALKAVVNAAVGDHDACLICLQDSHVAGCAIATAEAAISKAETTSQREEINR